MTALARYDAACRAVSEARSVDEVKDLRDKADAMRAYAKQAKNRQLEIDASEIRIRAERRIGEMMAAQRETVGMANGGEISGRRQIDGFRENPSISRPTLASAGIDKNLADRARRYAAVPADEFEGILSDRRERLQKDNERVTTDLIRAGDKRLARDAKEAALAEKIRNGAGSLAEMDEYGVVLADPPWRFEPYSRDTGMDRSADNHYPTSSTDDICALPIPAAKDAALFLWATAPMLPDALRVMAAWGFTYKSHLIWNKDRIGTGYWSRNKHELLLIGTRGSIPAPFPGTQPHSVVDGPVGRHSEKPAVFHEIIEAIYPNLPKLEMFSRANRHGWVAWGAEAVPEQVAA